MRAAETPNEGAALLTSAVRRRIVDTLAGLPRLAVEGRPTRASGLTAAELGQLLSLHSTTVRFHLDQLVAAGLLEAHFVRGGGAGRPKKKYVVVDGELTPSESPQAEGPYQVLATLLAEALDPDSVAHLSPEEAGAEWVRQRLADRGQVGPEEPAATAGEWLGKMGHVVDLLAEWGYTPDLSVDGAEGETTLTLRDCPFLELARVRPAVVCGVHRGLLRGALEVAGEEQAEVSLRPFVGPQTCHAVIFRDGGPADVEGLVLPDDLPATAAPATAAPATAPPSGAPHTEPVSTEPQPPEPPALGPATGA
ncbi:helix-turn-helix transcriptional regulator [Ornithinimicrobium sufpigmenti]|uniref:helix-turn-helix transcriptional regulator n=1 Tax=Ornithinimicrobium sufpigmenti TaxID=2508882 RepID=UPI0015E1B321|nr:MULTISPECIES: helix-turn-helix domain-containing protein [unclassified Ornithinimicrobium]